MDFANLPQAYRSVCSQHADRTLFRPEALTYGDTWRRAEARARFLLREGHGRGTVIALLAGNSPEWCITYLAITAIGAVALPLDTNLPPGQYPAMAQSAGARAAFAGDAFRGCFSGIPVYPITGGEVEPPGDPPQALAEAAETLTPRDLATLLFTSGTTGHPKIVALTHGNILHVALVCTALEEYSPADVTLAMLPLYHVYAFESTFMAPLLTGSQIVLLPSLKGPDILRALADHPVTIFPAAPQMWELFLDAILAKVRARSALQYRLFTLLLRAAPALRALGLGALPERFFAPVHDLFGRRIRFFISGGAPLKRTTFEAYRRMGFHLMEGYGLTETTGPIAIPHYREAAAGAVGPPIPGNEVRIRAQGDDGIGEIWLRGPAVMAGYYRNDAANREAFDAEGFFNTQDLGYVDGRGHLHITGRKKNVIVLDSGKNVYPEEIEDHLRTSPLIAEAAVVGRPVEGRMTVFAVVVPAPAALGPEGYEILRREIARLNGGLPAYRAVTRFALSADPLPRNSTRKVLLDEVIRRLEQGAYQTEAGGRPPAHNRFAAADVREEQIAAFLVRRLGLDALLANETLADHGIDSLGLIELVGQLEEELAIAVAVETLSPLMTLEAFVRALAAAGPSRGGNGLDEQILRGPVTTPLRPRWNPLAELILAVARWLSRRCWRLRILHPERLVPDNAIIVANHQSNLDPLWLLGALPWRHRRRLFVIGKRELRFLRLPLWGAPLLFVDRRGNVVPALKAAADVLRSGASLVIFPEGTRSRDGRLGRFKSGAAYLASHLDRPVIPVTIRGSGAILPPGRLLPRLGGGRRGELVVGEPIAPGRFADVASLNAHLRQVIGDALP